MVLHNAEDFSIVPGLDPATIRVCYGDDSAYEVAIHPPLKQLDLEMLDTIALDGEEPRLGRSGDFQLFKCDSVELAKHTLDTITGYSAQTRRVAPSITGAFILEIQAEAS